MKKCRITVKRIVEHRDLMDLYENPMEHACDMKEGQVFIANGWQKPEGMCDSAWETCPSSFWHCPMAGRTSTMGG